MTLYPAVLQKGFIQSLTCNIDWSKGVKRCKYSTYVLIRKYEFSIMNKNENKLIRKYTLFGNFVFFQRDFFSEFI